MKQLFLSILVLFFCTSVIAQKPYTFSLKLRKADKPLMCDFKIGEVIDGRVNKEYIGMIQKGVGNHKHPSNFETDLVMEVKKYVDYILPKKTDRILVMKIHHFWISEKTLMTKERGKFEVKLELFEEITGELQSLGLFESEIEGGGLDITKGHPKRIKEGIRECLVNFIWNKPSKDEYEGLERLDFSRGIPPNLKKGFYQSYTDLVYNNPLDEKMTTGKVIKVNDKISRYYLRNGEDKKAKHFAYYSKGELFLNVYSIGNSGSYYVKSATKGRYLVYLDKMMDQGAAVGFGLIGALASTEIRPFVFDLQTGKIVAYNKHFLLPLVENDFTDLADAHRKTKQKLDDRLELMQQINDRIVERTGN